MDSSDAVRMKLNVPEPDKTEPTVLITLARYFEIQKMAARAQKVLDEAAAAEAAKAAEEVATANKAAEESDTGSKLGSLFGEIARMRSERESKYEEIRRQIGEL